MGVYIKGMKMPESCHECVAGYGGFCFVAPPESDGICPDHGRADFCPLIEVKPHGRLIDTDAFLAEQRHLYCDNCAKRKGVKNGKVKFVYNIGDVSCRACDIGDVLDSIEDAPTIIRAEGIEETSNETAV